MLLTPTVPSKFEPLRTSEAVWFRCCQYLKAQMDIRSFQIWFEPLRAVALEGAALTLQVPDESHYQYIEENFLVILGEALKRELGNDFRLAYHVLAPRERSNKAPVRKAVGNAGQGQAANVGAGQPLPAATPSATEENAGNQPLTPPVGLRNPFIIPGIRRHGLDSRLNPKATFRSFIEGDCNRIARAAGLQISKTPGEMFNPLLVYGPTGTGKTHLVNAIGNAMTDLFPHKSVLYVSCETFMNQFLEHMRDNTISDFVNFYSSLDTLIVDDIHILEGKQKMQSIFFSIFNSLHQSRRQIILTCDKDPKELNIEARLLSRFNWGLVADIAYPDLETRMAIMMAVMEGKGIAVSAEILEFVCFHIKSSTRQIEAVVNSFVAKTLFGNRRIDMDLAKEIINEFVVVGVAEAMTVEGIMEAIADFTHISTEQMRDKSRRREIVEVRQIAVFLVRKLLPKQSLIAIGRAFGGRDHATVIHSCRVVENQNTVDETFRARVDEIERQVQLKLGKV